jgi:hypothetical protein
MMIPQGSGMHIETHRLPSRSTTSIVMALLALAQGVLGILRAVQWFEVGGDLSRAGILLLPMLGTIAIARGVFVGAIGALYVVFACGVFTGKRWAWSAGILAIILNAVAIVTIVIEGQPLASTLLWAVVPLILAGYLSQSRRKAVDR